MATGLQYTIIAKAGRSEEVVGPDLSLKSTAALAIRETAVAYVNPGAAFYKLQRYAEAKPALRAALRPQPD